MAKRQLRRELTHEPLMSTNPETSLCSFIFYLSSLLFALSSFICALSSLLFALCLRFLGYARNDTAPEHPTTAHEGATPPPQAVPLLFQKRRSCKQEKTVLLFKGGRATKLQRELTPHPCHVDRMGDISIPDALRRARYTMIFRQKYTINCQMHTSSHSPPVLAIYF